MITAEKFCCIWQNSSCVKGVANYFGISATTAHSKASIYRKRGIKLKFFNKEKVPIDVSRINILIGEVP